MHLDVSELRNFYYRSALGRATQGVLRGNLATLWPDLRGQSLIGFGFASPLLRPYLDQAERVISLMPGPQGVMSWPAGMPNISVLCEDTLWPIASGQGDRLLVVHGLETSEMPSALLDECWRVLAPGGKAIFIVPNRSGIWTRTDATPFGYGRPYTLSQLEAQLRLHRFDTSRSLSALYQPPSQRKAWRKAGKFFERVGRNLPILAAGGVLIVEVTKRTQAPVGPGLSAKVKRPLRVLEGLRGGVPEPVRGRNVSNLKIAR